MSEVSNFFKMCGRGIMIALRYLQKKQLLIPIVMLISLFIAAIIISPLNLGNRMVSILNNASAVVILAIGMTFVSAACGGQDISVGATAVMTGTLVLRLFNSSVPLIIAFLISCVLGVVLAMFNGVLVSRFKILPMVATLVLFTAGRKIAYAIGGNGPIYSPRNSVFNWFGSYIPGFPIPTSILITVVCIVIIFIVLKFSNLRLYTESVGINAKAARLNGINPEKIKMISFIILGLCVAVAGLIGASRNEGITYETVYKGIELDVILAVAIGGTALGGGKFNLVGSIIGAYTIQLLSDDVLLKLRGVTSESIRFYKAVFVVVIVVLGSPVVKEKLLAFWAKITNYIKEQKEREQSIKKEGA